MIPFLHLGPLTIPTYGLMVALAMLAAYFVLRADLARRGIAADAEIFIAIPTLAGIAGAKLYHVLETPREFFAHPFGELFSQFGFAWFGGLIAGFAAWVWLAWRHKIPLLAMLDAGSPAAALGYGIGRIGCFLSGDGDYGVPTSLPWGMSFPNGLVPTTERVHPTPIYELIVACAIAWILWRIGARQMKTGLLGSNRSFSLGTAKEELEGGRAKLKPGEAQRRMDASSEDERRKKALAGISRGSVFAAYLVLTGAARFLVEFIRINPQSVLAGTPFAMTNAQAASVASVAVGAVIWWRVRRRS